MFEIIKSNKKGVIITYLLVFGSIFLILFGGLLGFILLQHRQSYQKVAWNESLDIAEAGINYYRWCINNEVEQNCLSEKDYLDLTGEPIGKFSLEVNSTVSCGQNIRKEIISTGWTNDFPQVKRKISALYARVSVAKYSYILNSNVWVGDDHQIRGPYHSNGGIRMDGENQSTMTSAQSEWDCRSGTFGCDSCPISSGCHISGADCMCPGVFTTTSNSEPTLFSYPVPPFDFNAITIDLAQMKSVAGTSGIYFSSAATTSGNLAAKGYHVIFKNDGTFDVRIILNLSETYAYNNEEGYHYDYHVISDEYFYGSYNPPSSCSAIFFEDNIWVEGTVKGKISLASANLITTGVDTSVILPGSINYTTTDGSDGLVLIGEKDILIGPQSPSDMVLRGIFIAQKGKFGREHYPGNFKNSLKIYGSVISNGRVGTQWTSGGTVVSGYYNRESYFDPNLIYGPPPFVPYIEPDFKIINWTE